MDAAKEKGHTLFRGQIRPGNFQYMPMGYIVAEKTVGDQHSYGFRTPVFTKNAKSKAVFNELVSAHNAICADADPISNFWKLIEQFMV